MTGGIWLIGLGVLFATGYWWPGILFLVGDHGDRRGIGRRAEDGKRSTGASGCSHRLWAMMRFSMAVLFVALGVYAIIAAP